jgi:hypothetical protein
MTTLNHDRDKLFTELTEADTTGKMIQLLSSFPPERKLVFGWSLDGERRVKVSADSDGTVCLDAGSLMGVGQ